MPVKVYSANYHAYFHLGEIELIERKLREIQNTFFLKPVMFIGQNLKYTITWL